MPDGVQPGGTRLPTWNPVLFQAQGCDLLLFYKVGPSPSQWWGMVKASGDGGLTWGHTRRLGEKLIGPVKNKPIQLEDRTILAGSSTEDHGWRVHIELSIDGGKTWQFIGPINDGKQIRAIQPTLLIHPGGRIQMLCRTGYEEDGFIAQSWSYDGGRTWSSIQPTLLPNPNSGIDAVRLSDGRLLLVYNHSTRNQPGMGHKGRGILNVAISRDGKDWQAAMVLEHLDQQDSQFSYPSVIQTADGMVHIVYTWHRRRIKHVVIDPTQIQTVPMSSYR